MDSYTLRTCLAVFGVALLASACISVPERNPIPESLANDAQIPGIEKMRFWADEKSPFHEEWYGYSDEELAARIPAVFNQEHNYLAISGGGQKGAFTAGILNGWSEFGNRPEFTVVTGVSTGALIAPFAFLGSKYDAKLKAAFTEISTKDILEARGRVKSLLSDAVADTYPLEERITEAMNEEMLEEIAKEYRRGRTLNIITTNLDAGRPVSWNIGRIANSGAPAALDLVRQVMLASASIPGILPPVSIKVDAGGVTYEELHVDGGTSSIVYLYPLAMDGGKLARHLQVKGRANLFLILNQRLGMDWLTVERKTLPIVLRSVSILMNSVVRGDLYRLYLTAQRDNQNFKLAYIPEDFQMESREFFDMDYMNALFNVGYESAKSGQEWLNAPPDYETTQ